MNTDSTLKRVIHREMRAHFAWHNIDKIDQERNGFHFIVSVRSSPRQYDAAADLITALKRRYRNVHLDKTLSYKTMGDNNIYSMFITCLQPKAAA